MPVVKVIQPGHFTVWVTCLLKDYEDQIVANMVKRKYMIGMANDNSLSVGEPNQAAVVISFQVYASKEGTTTSEVYKDLTEVLMEKKIFFYSVVVSDTADASWAAGNMVLPASPKPTIELPKPEPDKNLN